MRTALSLTTAVAFAALIAAPAFAAEQIEEYRSETYDSEKTTVESVPAVRERTTVETVPAAPMMQKRSSETVVKEGKGDHDSDTEIETETKIEHDED